jgi:hypothetical protein
MTPRAACAALALSLTCACSPGTTDVLSVAVSPSGTRPPDAALAAAQEACSAFAADQIWDVQFEESPEGETLSWWIDLTPTATDTRATVLRRSGETRADPRFAALRSAAATFDLLFHGDRSEIGTISEEMRVACAKVPD